MNMGFFVIFVRVALVSLLELFAAPARASAKPSSDSARCDDPVSSRLYQNLLKEAACTDYRATAADCDALTRDVTEASDGLLSDVLRCINAHGRQWCLKYSETKDGDDVWAGWSFGFNGPDGRHQLIGTSGRALIGKEWVWLADDDFANFGFPAITGPTLEKAELDGDPATDEVILYATRFSIIVPGEYLSQDNRYFDRVLRLGRAWIYRGGKVTRFPGLARTLIAGVKDVDDDGVNEVLTYGPFLVNVLPSEQENRLTNHVAHGPAYALFRSADGSYSSSDPRQRVVVEKSCESERITHQSDSPQQALLFAIVCDRALRGLPSWAPRKSFAGYSEFARTAIDAATLRHAERDPLPFSFERREPRLKRGTGLLRSSATRKGGPP